MSAACSSTKAEGFVESYLLFETGFHSAAQASVTNLVAGLSAPVWSLSYQCLLCYHCWRFPSCWSSYWAPSSSHLQRPGTGALASISVFSSCNWSFQGKSLGHCGSIENLGLGVCPQYSSLAIRNSITWKEMYSPWPNQEEETKRSRGEGSEATTVSHRPSQTILVKVWSGWFLSQFQLCQVVQALLSWGCQSDSPKITSAPECSMFVRTREWEPDVACKVLFFLKSKMAADAEQEYISIPSAKPKGGWHI